MYQDMYLTEYDFSRVMHGSANLLNEELFALSYRATVIQNKAW